VTFAFRPAADFAGRGDEAEVFSRLLVERGVSPEALLSVGGEFKKFSKVTIGNRR